MNVPTEKEIQTYQEVAEAHVEHMHSNIRQIVEGHPNVPIAGAKKWTSKTSKVGWGALGFLAFTGDFYFDDGTRLSFTGKGGGASVGGGVAWGVLTVNVEPSELEGIPVNFMYTVSPVAAVTLSFWKSKTGAFVGTYVGGGLSFNIGGFEGGGHGDFK